VTDAELFTFDLKSEVFGVIAADRAIS